MLIPNSLGCICYTLNHKRLLPSNYWLKIKLVLQLKLFRLIMQKNFIVLNLFINESGIQHRFTCPHTHKQNGVTERKHRHIVDMGLSMLFAASLPMNFWGEVFLTASQIINVLPSSVIQGKTPVSYTHLTLPTNREV